jgi:hypothetical protein
LVQTLAVACRLGLRTGQPWHPLPSSRPGIS